jgi:hypothetical protein
MSASLANLLTVHVIIGVTGVFLFGGVVAGLLKRKTPIKTLKCFSALGFLAFIVSWISGGYYYIVHYGANVKPIIKAGATPWAHAVIMETKEHIFLFLPFLAFISMIGIWLAGRELDDMKKVKNAVMFVSLLAFIIGVAVALMGIVISGSAVI